MDSRTRERLTGAAILVAVIVLVVPELLSRPRHALPRPEVVVDEAPVRSYTLSLGDTQQSAAPLRTEAPARVVPQGVARAVPQGPAVPQGAAVATRSPVAVKEAPSPSAISAAPVATRNPRPAAHDVRPAERDARPTEDEARPAERNPRPRPAVREARAASASAGAARGKPERTESSAHGWAVQVGSFGNRGNADRLVRSLKLKGYGAFVTESSSRGRTWYRVRVGPERDRAAADALAGRLRAAGLRGAVAQPR